MTRFVPVCLCLLAAMHGAPLRGQEGSAPAGPVAVVDGEELHGLWEGDAGEIAAFRGIPFAAPPVGELRWRKPHEPEPWNGPQQAVRFAPACMQGASMTEWYGRVIEAFGAAPEIAPRPRAVSEDCLYLNVWSPELEPASPHPVMVYVHGGSNSGGWSYEPNYLGHRLAARGVVVVTIAYRLGPFGFFAHPALDNGPGQPVANFALLDIEAAFDWVREHIAAFGGDPADLTAFGESAGALDLIDLAAVGLDRGGPGSLPFARLISQSIGGSLVERQTLAEEQAVGEWLVRETGLSGELDGEDLRRIPAAALMEASRRLPASHYFDSVIDGRTLLRAPLQSFRDAQRVPLDLIAGTNAAEWYMYLAEDTDAEDLNAWVEETAADLGDALQEAVADAPSPRHALDRLRTARRMLCPSRFLARTVNRRGGRAWAYYFARQRPGQGGDKLGAYHGTELPYVFGTHDGWLPTTAVDRALTDTVMSYWARFARTGDPNRPGLPDWPRYTQENPVFLRIDDPLSVMRRPATDLCRWLGPEAMAARQERP